MYNLLIALALGAAVWGTCAATHLLSAYEATLPGLLVAVVALIWRARATFRQLEGLLQQSGQALQRRPPNVQQAMAHLRRGYRLAPWQFGLRPQIDAQLGMLSFMTGDLSAARPLLGRALWMSPWLAGAMLAVIQYKQKDPPAMRKTMAVVTRKAKKQGLAWNLYAYMLSQLGDHEGAIRTLSEGARHAGHDPRVKESLLALQNGRKMKMRGYHEQWYQFQLERPPVVRQDPRAMGRSTRRGQQRGRF
jgi:tetratricopeptide (TPR) repeat protein